MSANGEAIQVAIEGNQESFIQDCLNLCLCNSVQVKRFEFSNKSKEIALNGQETWIQPLSMSEKLQLATQKIDFNKELEAAEKKEPDSEEAIIVETEQQENPWDPIRKNIVEALQEVRVLHDFLAVLCHNPAGQAAPAMPNPLANIPGMAPQA